jgi:hypothetical protein
MSLSLYALTCGHIEGEFGRLMEGGKGKITVPIPVFLIEHPKGRALFDTGLHPRQIIYRANILIAETGEKAQQALAQYPRQPAFLLMDGVAAALMELDQRNVAGEGRQPAHVNRMLPINFCGGPDEIVAQLKQCREQIGVGVVDLFANSDVFEPARGADEAPLQGKRAKPDFLL